MAFLESVQLLLNSFIAFDEGEVENASYNRDVMARCFVDSRFCVAFASFSCLVYAYDVTTAGIPCSHISHKTNHSELAVASEQASFDIDVRVFTMVRLICFQRL